MLDVRHGKSDAVMLDNAEWLTKLNYIEMLRDIGRHFSVNRMLTLESVKLRLEREQEMSFIEFNYQILQAYDFVELARRTGCNLQMGGSDQWGNIVTGVDLGRRMGTHQLYALTTPLLTTSSGAKMGKTADGAVWLNEDQFSAYDYWQFWRNTEDADVGRFLKLFTTLPMTEIEQARGASGRRDQRGQEGSGHRGHGAHARSRQGRGSRPNRGSDVRAGCACRRSADGRDRRAELDDRDWACSLPSSRPAARQIRGARRADKISVAAACASTMRRYRTRRPSVRERCDAEGVIKLSLGRKRHVLLKPI